MRNHQNAPNVTNVCFADLGKFGQVFIFSWTLQCSVILVIIVVTVVTNCCIIINVGGSDIKNRIISFVLIKNLCIVDLCGALLILPVPLVATFQGDTVHLISCILLHYKPSYLPTKVTVLNSHFVSTTFY